MKILSTLSKEALFHAYVQAIAQKLDPYFVFLLEEEMYRRNLRFQDYGISQLQHATCFIFYVEVTN
ncbi:sporulation histidine kinase inhibitor Sda [Bacillus sp. S2(2024)]|uniref:sporulation histidine kinase inhibitor Sda n=1 Tax=Bacillus sp. S2(2024) TaxID=3162887 RepID=UPI003D25294F